MISAEAANPDRSEADEQLEFPNVAETKLEKSASKESGASPSFMR
jgi:hypothetical protein